MELNLTNARPVIEAHIDAGNPVLVTGGFGVGKSDVVRQIAAARGWPLIDLRLSTLDPVDLRGLPSAKDGKATFLPMGELPNADRDGEDGILFLDELPQAPMAVQNAAFSLVLDRRIGDYHLPAGWRVVAAGNRVQDRAGAGRLNSALANRFSHLGVVVDVDAWCKWALASGKVPAEVVAFIRFRPHLLDNVEVDRPVNATPRTWEMASRLIGTGLAPGVELAALAGTVGEGPAAELVAFLKVWRTLPSVDGIFMNPEASDVPEEGATLYALCGALARKVTENSVGAFCAYLKRLPPEYGVLAMKDATLRDATLEKTHEAVAFYSANADLYL